MAASGGRPDKKATKSLRYTTLQANFDFLAAEVKKAFTALSKKAYEGDLIDENCYAVILNKSITLDLRVHLLLEAILDRVSSSVHYFEVFVSILHNIPILSSAADHLTQAYSAARQHRRLSTGSQSSHSSHHSSTGGPPKVAPDSQGDGVSGSTNAPLDPQKRIPIDSGIIDVLTDESANIEPTTDYPRLEPHLPSLLNPTEAVSSAETHASQSSLHELVANSPRTDFHGQPYPTHSTPSTSNVNPPIPNLELNTTDLQPATASVELEDNGIVFQASEPEGHGVQESGQQEGADVMLVDESDLLASRSDFDLFSDENVQSLKEHIDYLRHELRQSKSELQQKDASICDLKEKLADLAEKINTLLVELEAKKKEVEDITSEKDEEISSLRSVCEAQSVEVERLKNQVAEKEKEKKELSKDYDEKVSQLSEHQATTQAEIVRIKMDYEKKIKDLRGTLKETNIQRENAVVRLEQMKTEMALKELEMVKKLSTQEKEKHKLEMRIQGLTIKLKEQEKLLLQKDKELAVKDKALAEKEMVQMEKELKRLRRLVSETSLDSRASLSSHQSGSIGSISECDETATYW